MKYTVTFLLNILLLAPIVSVFAQLSSDSTEESSEFVANKLDIHLITPFDYVPPDQSPELITDRLSCIESTIRLPYHEKVHSFINYFTIRNREYTRMVMRKQDMYFPIFEKYLAEYGLPDELKYLSIIESGLNPRAVSRAKAVGLWQFMSATGRYFGLLNNRFTDDRMDPEKSTEAACKYLAQLYGMFDDWHLALAAYNSGPGTVRRAIRRSGYKKTFWEVYRYLPSETRSYVPQFIAMIYTLNYSEEHNLWEPDKEELLPHDTIQIHQNIHLETLAQLTGSCTADFQMLNPSIIGDLLPKPTQPFVINLPTHAHYNLQQNRAFILDSVQKVATVQLKNIKDPLADRMMVTYRVKPGDALSVIAMRNQLRVRDIQRWNNLKSTRIFVGQKLKLWVKNERYAESYSSAKVYTVQPGDTLWGIARKRGISVQQLKVINNLTSNVVKVGQKLKMR